MCLIQLRMLIFCFLAVGCSSSFNWCTSTICLTDIWSGCKQPADMFMYFFQEPLTHPDPTELIVLLSMRTATFSSGLISYLTSNCTMNICIDRWLLSQKNHVFLYFRWTACYTELKETVHRFVVSSHKWTRRPLTLNETQMKTPLWVWPRLLEADIFLRSDPTGSWRSLIFSS